MSLNSKEEYSIKITHHVFRRTIFTICLMCVLVSGKIDIGHFYQGGLSRTTINHGGYLDFKTHALSTKNNKRM